MAQSRDVVAIRISISYLNPVSGLLQKQRGVQVFFFFFFLKGLRYYLNEIMLSLSFKIYIF